MAASGTSGNLANFYLNTYGRKNALILKWFGKTEGTFLVAFGEDAAPFGKNETDRSFLVSFLNTGKRVASSNDNFLVFGANCDKKSSLVKKYIQAVCKQIVDLEGKVVEICGLHCTFHFQEIKKNSQTIIARGWGWGEGGSSTPPTPPSLVMFLFLTFYLYATKISWTEIVDRRRK